MRNTYLNRNFFYFSWNYQKGENDYGHDTPEEN